MRRPALALVVATVIVGGAGTASAHTERTSTSPADGARLRAAPAAITVRYSEPVAEVVESSVALDGAPLRGTAPARLSPRDAAVVRIPLPPAIGPGRVSARWVVRSDDGHLLEGTVGFTIAVAPLGASIARVAAALDAAVRAMDAIRV